MAHVNVRYAHGFNISGTGQHEVLEYVVKSDLEVHGVVEEGPYVILYTDQVWTAQAIAALLEADGTDNNFPTTPLARARAYANKRFRTPDAGLIHTGE